MRAQAQARAWAAEAQWPPGLAPATTRTTQQLAPLEVYPLPLDYARSARRFVMLPAWASQLPGAQHPPLPSLVPFFLHHHPRARPLLSRRKVAA